MAGKKPFTTIDGYISTFPADIQAILENVRQAIQKAAPAVKVTVGGMVVSPSIPVGYIVLQAAAP